MSGFSNGLMALSAFGDLRAASLGAPGRLFLWLRPTSSSSSKRWIEHEGSGKTPQPTQENVVRIPRAWQLRLERGASKRRAEAPQATPRHGKLLLRSRREELSQTTGMTLGRWEQPRLVSSGWKHHLSRGDYFQLERTRQGPPQEREEPPEGSSPSFSALGVEPRLVAILQDTFSISKPTPVQRRALPTLLAGRSALCAAETGSGKTLAYLLPMVQRLLHSRGMPRALTSIASPRALVVLPSRELSGQVRSVASYLCNPLGFQVREIGGGRSMDTVQQKLRAGPADLLVATPGALCKALRRRMLSLEKLLYLVLDEVDTLLDPTFVDLVEDVLQQAPITSSSKEVNDFWDPKAQLVAVGATLPKGLSELLRKVADLSSFSILTSYSLHHLQSHVEQKFVRLKAGDKVSELLQLIKERHSQSGAVLVFCNNASTVNWLGYILDDHKVKHLRLQGQMPAVVRADIFTTFQKGKPDILICTDIASRGLDTTHVELVVNYDFPQMIHDYLHRVGRVGRVGSKFPGTVISFVTYRWDVDLVQKIEIAARKRAPLPGMDPLVKKLPPAVNVSHTEELNNV